MWFKNPNDFAGKLVAASIPLDPMVGLIDSEVLDIALELGRILLTDSAKIEDIGSLITSVKDLPDSIYKRDLTAVLLDPSINYLFNIHPLIQKVLLEDLVAKKSIIIEAVNEIAPLTNKLIAELDKFDKLYPFKKDYCLYSPSVSFSNCSGNFMHTKDPFYTGIILPSEKQDIVDGFYKHLDKYLKFVKFKKTFGIEFRDIANRIQLVTRAKEKIPMLYAAIIVPNDKTYYYPVDLTKFI